MIHLVGPIIGFLRHHWWMLGIAYSALTVWGHQWQRVDRIDRKWSVPLVAFVVLVVAYQLWPNFRRAVRIVALVAWCYIARQVGWFGRLVWATITYWAVLIHIARLYGWSGIWAGARIDVRTYRAFRWLRQNENHARTAVRIAHAEDAILGALRVGNGGLLHGLIRPGAGKSLQVLTGLAEDGSIGATLNARLIAAGLKPHHHVTIRPTGNHEGEGEILLQPTDPLIDDYDGPRLVTK